MQKIFAKIKRWCVLNAPVLLYFACAVFVEMTAVFVVEGSPWLSRPFLSLGLLFFFCGILLAIRNNRARVIVSAVLLGVQIILVLAFSVIFDMTDQYFDWGMLNLRNDAFAILESIPVDFITFYTGLFFFVIFFAFGLRHSYRFKYAWKRKRSVFFYVGLSLAGIATMGIAFTSYYPRTNKDKYDEMVDGRSASAYSAYGMIGNLVGELGNTIFQKDEPVDGGEIDGFIYSDISTPTKYFGVAKDKNVVVILAESLEWYAFLRGDSSAGSLQGEYVNGLEIPQEVLTELYPNLNEYYNESLVMTNYHSREKTDIAEVTSILGSYPTDAYVNYEYAENTIPYTLPNILKAETGGNIHIRSFHNGFKSFYNRAEAHPMLGFEGLTDLYDMKAMSDKTVAAGGKPTFYNYMDNNERCLDSEMVETAKDLMFPTDARFYTYITTITMHGMYSERENLKKENNTKLAEKFALLETYKPKMGQVEDYENAEALYYYMTTAIEFDYMLGCMKKDLVKKDLWEDTVVVLFSDHNTYYQGTSNYVKDVFNYGDEGKFTDLYNVPLMIRDSDLARLIPAEERVSDKFVCTADIVPTLLDLLGIRYFTNLYYGNSVFADTQSVLYSRAYDVFIGDGVLRRSVKGSLYEYEGNNELGIPVANTLVEFEREGTKLVSKIKYCDYIFKQDHFGKASNYARFREKMRAINA